MNSKRHYYVVVGSKAYFDSYISKVTNLPDVSDFLTLVRLFDAIKKSDYPYFEDRKTTLLIVKNNNYHGIVDSAHDRLGALIEDLTEEDAEIYVHNPPVVLKNYLEDQKARDIIDIDYFTETYGITRDSKQFAQNMESIANHILGQQEAIEEISKSLWYLTTVNRENLNP